MSPIVLSSESDFLTEEFIVCTSSAYLLSVDLEEQDEHFGRGFFSY
jgi:hypothetical protein